MAATEDDFWKS